MSAWKQFLASDIIVNPFVVNKGFTFPSSQFATGSDGQLVGIDRFLGENVDWFTNKSTTGTLSTEYTALIYNSAKQLYYTNFLSSSTGDNVAQPVLFPGSDSSGDVLIGSVESPLYDNFLQSTLTASRYWPTGSGDQIAVISISSKLYGEYIVPTSFTFDYSSSFKAYDDGEGNLYSSASFSWDTGVFTYYSESLDFKIYQDTTTIFINPPVPLPDNFIFISASWLGDPGNSPFRDVGTGDPVQEIDNQGITFDNNTGEIISDTSVWEFTDPGVDVGPILVTWISDNSIVNSISANENVGNIIYTHGISIFTNQDLPLSDMVTQTNVTCSFSSSMTIFETQYKATIRESEFNATLNPSAQKSGSLVSVNSSLFYQRGDGTLNDNITGSYFSPYVTTVGLYDEAQNLLAVGKLAQPLPTSDTTDTTILVNLDR
jgi:hypothetical protein